MQKYDFMLKNGFNKKNGSSSNAVIEVTQNVYFWNKQLRKSTNQTSQKLRAQPVTLIVPLFYFIVGLGWDRRGSPKRLFHPPSF